MKNMGMWMKRADEKVVGGKNDHGRGREVEQKLYGGQCTAKG